tara:strand:+ start:331 stop:516 length:186 start_codon:yes stop_codon:yes gene_type:complete
MKVGDLVKCTTLHGTCKNGKVGVIVNVFADWKPHRYYVMLSGKTKVWPFLDNQLELVSESR